MWPGGCFGAPRPVVVFGKKEKKTPAGFATVRGGTERSRLVAGRRRPEITVQLSTQKKKMELTVQLGG